MACFLSGKYGLNSFMNVPTVLSWMALQNPTQLRFDPHKLVVSEIAYLIRSHLEEGKPSWKQLSGTQRNMFFDLFQLKDVYKKLKEKGENFEVVFIPLDDEEESLKKDLEGTYF
ncbi:aminopeptidase M1 [Trifolium repens]|nr:aminopeptidase M1 [Trifolium repens]